MSGDKLANNRDLVDLQAAHVTQEPLCWTVRRNITGDESVGKQLFDLPGRLTEAEVFLILKFGREFELRALNAGIQFGKKKQKEIDDQRIIALENNNRLAAEENERLATALDRLTKNE